MKSWLVLLVIAVSGIGIGSTRTYLEMHGSAELFFTEDYWARAREQAISREQNVDRAKAAKVEILGDAVFDFGSMERFSRMRHTFRLKSVGESDLELRPGRTTCKCTVSLVSNRVVKPGEVSEIIVEWAGQTLMDSPDFEQTVEVETNDPDQSIVRLKVHGYVTETIRALPGELVVGMVSSNTGSEAQFQLYGFRSDRIDVLESTWENADTARYFDVSYEPLSKEEVEKEKGASCGLLAKVTVKPGLPLGPINQTIHIKAKVDKEVVMEVPVKGRAWSDIRIASSPEFEANRNLLKFGALKRTDSAKAVLQLYVTGPYRNETRLSIGEVDPAEYLKVNIGPPKELNNGKAIQYLVTIEIPAGLGSMNRMGAEQAALGRVVLETTHPQTKQVPIHVKFSVE
jgi:hypothetical protein